MIEDLKEVRRELQEEVGIWQIKQWRENEKDKGIQSKSLSWVALP